MVPVLYSFAMMLSRHSSYVICNGDIQEWEVSICLPASCTQLPLLSDLKQYTLISPLGAARLLMFLALGCFLPSHEQAKLYYVPGFITLHGTGAIGDALPHTIRSLVNHHSYSSSPGF